MWIKKAITINWGTLPDREYPLGAVTLLAGHTGSGKSTLEDAIQTVMTAAHHGLFSYNPGQDEARQGARSGKKPRSLASYILGADRDRYARPNGAHGYAALVFASSGEEEEGTLTAVFGVTADLERVGTGERVRRTPREVNTQMMLVSGEIGIEDLADRAGPYALSVTDTKDIYNRLRERLGRDAVREFASKESYLSYLWGALRDRSGGLEVKVAKRAAQTFSQAMAYKPIASINRFVKEEILRPKDVGTDVAHLSSLVRQMHKMREDAANINRRTVMLEGLVKEGEQTVRAWGARRERIYVKAAGLAHRNQRDIDRTRAESIEAKKEADGAQQRYDALEQDIKNLAALTRQLGRQRSEHPKLAERGQLEDALRRFGEDYRRLRNQFREKAQGLNQLTNVLRALRSTPSRLRVKPLFAEGFRTLEQAIPLAIGLESEQLHEDVVHVLTGEAESGETGEALERIRGQLRESEAAITLIAEEIGAEGGLLSVVQEQYFQRVANEKELVDRRGTLGAEIRELAEARRVSYPRSASEGLSLLREQLPNAKARILCDLVSVRASEEEWQQAIEGYLGGNRFMLIVEQAFEVEANRMLRRHPAKVAQTLRVLQRASQPLPADSIVECLSVEDAIARAYLKAAYGDVVKVDDFETLRRTARGVMRDGRSAAGFATGRSWVEDGDLVFGESGRRRRLTARRKEFADLELELTQVGELRSELQGLKGSLEAVRAPNAEETVSGMIRVRKDLTDARARLAMLDVGDGAEIEARYQQTENEYNEALNAKEQAATDRAIANRKVEEMERRIEGLRSDQDSLIAGRKQAYAVLEWLDEASDEYVLAQRIDGLDAQASGFDDAMERLLENQATGLEGTIAAHLGSLRDGVRDYNQACDTYQRLTWPNDTPLSSVSTQEHVAALVSVIRETRLQYERHRNHLLAQAEAELKELAAQVNSAITANFCQVINRSLQDGRDQIQRLNRALDGYRFNDETYRFHAEPVADMSRYSRLFDELARAYELRGEKLDLFAGESATPQEESRRTLDELLDLLEHGDEGQAREKLEQITDYRNYHNYDVVAQTSDGHRMSLGESATGSGGQTETPAYVIRLAAISNAFGINEGRGRRLRSVVLDEAFSKMDEPRTAEVLRLFDDPRFGFQVVFAMPTKNAGAFQPLLTHKYVFTRTKATMRQGELPDRTLVKLEMPNREATRDLWKRRMEDVEIQARLEFEEENPSLDEVGT